MKFQYYLTAVPLKYPKKHGIIRPTELCDFAVKSDGTVVSRVSEKVDTKQEADEAATPVTHVETEVEVPSLGIHRTVFSHSQQDASVERHNNVRT